ncbi:MAG: tripartite tricarboxylate transporter substrate binding protein [Betaproteobacteria bacterium]|nr:tripartite tricarboxylate transporter substrate binding protein [Betaproteobacteria bacterium]
MNSIARSFVCGALRGTAACIAATFVAAAPGLAQSYPTKSIRFIVPFPPGGGNDTIARQVGQKLSAAFGQQVLVDNRPGAGGTIGAELAAKSPPDGYTLFLAGVASHGINPNLRKKLPYDPLRDFDAVSLIASAPLLVVVHPSLPVKSVKELIALAKAKPGQINFASNGAGGSSHLAVELFKMTTGTEMVHVPYKGLSLALTELLSGEVQLMFSSAVAMLPQVKAGRLRAIAMTGAKRSPAIPDIPTVAETGVRGYETGSWYGVVVPAGTPKAAIGRLSQEIVGFVRSPETIQRMNSEAVIPVGSTPDEFTGHIRKELARWAEVIKRAGLRLE